MAIARPSGTFNSSYSEDMAILRTKEQWFMLAALIGFLLAMPLFASDHMLAIGTTIAVFLIAVHGLNITTGYCGQINLGQAAFMAVGGYTSALLAIHLGLSFWLCLPTAGLVTGLVGLLFGLPSVKVKGFYLALTTLAAQYIIIYIIKTPAYEWTGGSICLPGIPPARLGGIVLASEASYYYLAIAFTIVMTFFAKNLARSNIGRAFVAIRDNDLAAEAMGISLARYKLLAFFIGCFYAGIAGSLWAHYTRVISPDDFTLLKSIWFVGMLIVGGLGSTTGAILGVIFIQVLDELVVIFGPTLASLFPAIGAGISAALALMVFALVVILFLVFEPRGLAHRWQIFKNSYRLWPFSY